MSSNVIGEATVLIRPDARSFDSQLRSSVSGSIGRIAKTAGAALVAGGLVRTIASQIGAAGDLQTSLRESVGLLGETGRAADRTFSSFSANVAALSRELGIAQEGISKGLYDALGAGVPRGNVVDFLRVAGKAAIAGTTDLSTAVDGLTTVTNAYGLKASDAQMVSDSLFQTVNAGKVTFDELAQSLFNVGPIASSAGVDIQTVGAALATLTAGGVPAAEATTQLRSVIQSLVAPSVRAEKLIAPVFEKAGFASGQAALKTLGFQKTLQLVTDAAGGSSVKLTRLLGRTEALNAALTLTGKGSGLFSEQLIAQQKAAGVTDKALAQIEKSAGRSFKRAKNAARNFGLEVGNAAAPAIASLADDLEEGLNRISSTAGFKSGTSRIAQGIADAITDPQTIESAKVLGSTVVDVFGAMRTAATATAPALQSVASVLASIASSPVGPALLLTGVAFSGVNRLVGATSARFTAAKGAVKAYRVEQVAAAAAATTAGAQSVSAIGLVGPSSVKAAATATKSASRIAGAFKGIGRGVASGLGGPAGIATLGISALAAGAFILSQREGNAAQQARAFNDALAAQAAAADTATAALNRQRDAVTGIIGGKVAVDQATATRDAARTRVAEVTAAPAADFGGEAGKKKALAVANNILALSERQLNLARSAGGKAAADAILQSNQAQAGAAKSVANAQAAITATGNLTKSQVQASLATGIGRNNVINYAKGLAQQVRAQSAASTTLAQSAVQSRAAAKAVDTSTASGKKQAAQLKAEAAESTRSAAAQRANALATAQRAIATNKVIVASQKTSKAEKAAASARIKTLTSLQAQIVAANQKAGKAGGDALAKGVKGSEAKVRAAGKASGEAGAKGAEGAAPAAQASGAVIGTNLGLGMILGMNAQTAAVQAAGARLGAAGAQGAADGAETGSPSKLTTKTGRELGLGLQVGIQQEQSRTSAVMAAAVGRAITDAGRAGVTSARTQGRLVARSLATTFRSEGSGIGAGIAAVARALSGAVEAIGGGSVGSVGAVVDRATDGVLGGVVGAVQTSTKPAEAGKAIADGLLVGIQQEQGRTTTAIAASTRASIIAAAGAGVRNARTQGRLIARGLADGFRVTGPTIKTTIKASVSSALRDSLVTARENLTGFGQSLGDLIGRAIDTARPDFSARTSALSARSGALDAASAADEERSLRNAVALAEAGAEGAKKRFAAAQAAAARRTPEQDARLSPLARERERQRLEGLRIAAQDPARQQRADLDRFLLQADSDRLSADQTAADEQTQIRKDALAQQLADLTANLSAGRITYEQFNGQINATLAANAPNIGAIGAQLGTAFTDQFNLALRSLRVQGKQISISPALPAGFLAGIERPAQVALAEAVTTRNVLRSAFATELERVRQSQLANRQALQDTFTKESSAGGTRIVASEQRQLNARAAQHTETLKELRALQRAFLQNPPQEAVTVIVNPPPGATPEDIANAIARRTSQRNARAAAR